MVGDGITDDTAAIQSFLNALAALPSGVGCLSRKASGAPMTILITSMVACTIGTSGARLRLLGGGSKIVLGQGFTTQGLVFQATGAALDYSVSVEVMQLRFAPAAAPQSEYALAFIDGLGPCAARQLDFFNVTHCLHFQSAGGASFEMDQPVFRSDGTVETAMVGAFFEDPSDSFGCIGRVLSPFANRTDTPSVTIKAFGSNVIVENPALGGSFGIPQAWNVDFDASSTLRVNDPAYTGFGCSASNLAAIASGFIGVTECVFGHSTALQGTLVKPTAGGTWQAVGVADDPSQATGIVVFQSNARAWIALFGHAAGVSSDNNGALSLGDFVKLSPSVAGTVRLAATGDKPIGRVLSVSGIYSSASPLVALGQYNGTLP